MQPLTDSERHAAALAVVRTLLANANEVSKQHPSGTRFTPVLIDKDRHIIQVAVEEPSEATQPTLEPVRALV